MKRLILLVILGSNAAAVQDMSGKIFTFSQRSDDAFVKVMTTSQRLEGVTLCHRSFTDLKHSHSFFSLTSPDFESYGFQTCYNADSKEMSVWVKSVRADFGSIDYGVNEWHSICSTWDSSSGLVQLWMNGRPFTKQYNVEFPITGPFQIILGQEQSKYDRLIGFIRTMTFTGFLTDVNMWDYVLPPCEIHRYMDKGSYAPGNVLNWTALEFAAGSRIFVEEEQTCSLSTF